MGARRRGAHRVAHRLARRAPALFEEAEDSAQELDAYLGAGEVLVAVAAERVIGHLQLIDGPDASEIKNMAVAPDQRGRGVGRMLVRAAIDRTRSRLIVATAAADVGNLRFYQRLGFRVRSVERDAFTPATGYPADTAIDGIPLRDRVWLDLDVGRGPGVPLFCDTALAARIERAEAALIAKAASAAAAGFVKPIAGGVATYAGPDSPFNRSPGWASAACRARRRSTTSRPRSRLAAPRSRSSSPTSASPRSGGC